MKNILIVEDDAVLRNGIRELLEESAYYVRTAENDEEARQIRAMMESSGSHFDLYILDIMLEHGSGYTLCEEIRQTEDTPIIFLSALDDQNHIIQGLDLGADDYITKPFHRRELLARVAAHIRRGNQQFCRKAKEPLFRSGDIVFRIWDERIYIREEEIQLRKLEIELLKIFLESNGRLLRREQILEYIWDKDGLFVEDNTLSVHISRLRKRIGNYHGEEYIKTIRGIGYRWKQPIHREGEEA